MCRGEHKSIYQLVWFIKLWKQRGCVNAKCMGDVQIIFQTQLTPYKLDTSIICCSVMVSTSDVSKKQVGDMANLAARFHGWWEGFHWVVKGPFFRAAAVLCGIGGQRGIKKMCICKNSKHIKNATWPEGCGQRNEKTRKPENQKTRKRERFWPFSGFRRFRVFGFSPFSPFSRFRVFAVFAVFAFSPFSCSQVDSSRFRVFVFSHVQSWRFRATECTASVHTLHMPKALTTFVFIVLRNGLRRYIFYTCPTVWKPSCSKCYRKDCFGTYFTHAQSCDNVHVQSAMEWAASVHTLHMPKGGKTFVFKVLQKVLRQYIIYTCPKLWQRSCS